MSNRKVTAQRYSGVEKKHLAGRLKSALSSMSSTKRHVKGDGIRTVITRRGSPNDNPQAFGEMLREGLVVPKTILSEKGYKVFATQAQELRDIFSTLHRDTRTNGLQLQAMSDHACITGRFLKVAYGGVAAELEKCANDMVLERHSQKLENLKDDLRHGRQTQLLAYNAVNKLDNLQTITVDKYDQLLLDAGNLRDGRNREAGASEVREIIAHYKELREDKKSFIHEVRAGKVSEEEAGRRLENMKKKAFDTVYSPLKMFIEDSDHLEDLTNVANRRELKALSKDDRERMDEHPNDRVEIVKIAREFVENMQIVEEHKDNAIMQMLALKQGLDDQIKSIDDLKKPTGKPAEPAGGVPLDDANAGRLRRDSGVGMLPEDEAAVRQSVQQRPRSNTQDSGISVSSQHPHSGGQQPVMMAGNQNGAGYAPAPVMMQPQHYQAPALFSAPAMQQMGAGGMQQMSPFGGMQQMGGHAGMADPQQMMMGMAMMFMFANMMSHMFPQMGHAVQNMMGGMMQQMMPMMQQMMGGGMAQPQMQWTGGQSPQNTHMIPSGGQIQQQQNNPPFFYAPNAENGTQYFNVPQTQNASPTWGAGIPQQQATDRTDRTQQNRQVHFADDVEEIDDIDDLHDQLRAAQQQGISGDLVKMIARLVAEEEELKRTGGTQAPTQTTPTTPTEAERKARLGPLDMSVGGVTGKVTLLDAEDPTQRSLKIDGDAMRTAFGLTGDNQVTQYTLHDGKVIKEDALAANTFKDHLEAKDIHKVGDHILPLNMSKTVGGYALNRDANTGGITLQNIGKNSVFELAGLKAGDTVNSVTINRDGEAPKTIDFTGIDADTLKTRHAELNAELAKGGNITISATHKHEPVPSASLINPQTITAQAIVEAGQAASAASAFALNPVQTQATEIGMGVASGVTKGLEAGHSLDKVLRGMNDSGVMQPATATRVRQEVERLPRTTNEEKGAVAGAVAAHLEIGGNPANIPAVVRDATDMVEELIGAGINPTEVAAIAAKGTIYRFQGYRIDHTNNPAIPVISPANIVAYTQGVYGRTLRAEAQAAANAATTTIAEGNTLENNPDTETRVLNDGDYRIDVRNDKGRTTTLLTLNEHDIIHKDNDQVTAFTTQDHRVSGYKPEMKTTEMTGADFKKGLDELRLVSGTNDRVLVSDDNPLFNTLKDKDNPQNAVHIFAVNGTALTAGDAVNDLKNKLKQLAGQSIFITDQSGNERSVLLPKVPESPKNETLTVTPLKQLSGNAIGRSGLKMGANRQYNVLDITRLAGTKFEGIAGYRTHDGATADQLCIRQHSTNGQPSTPFNIPNVSLAATTLAPLNQATSIEVKTRDAVAGVGGALGTPDVYTGIHTNDNSFKSTELYGGNANTTALERDDNLREKGFYLKDNVTLAGGRPVVYMRRAVAERLLPKNVHHLLPKTGDVGIVGIAGTQPLAGGEVIRQINTVGGAIQFDPVFDPARNETLKDAVSRVFNIDPTTFTHANATSLNLAGLQFITKDDELKSTCELADNTRTTSSPLEQRGMFPKITTN